MNRERLIEEFKEFQCTGGAEAIRLKNVYDDNLNVWPILRLAIPSLLRSAEQSPDVGSTSSGAEISPEQKHREELKSRASGLKQFLRWRDTARGKILVATRPEYHVREGSETKDKFVQPFLDAGLGVASISFPGFRKAAWDSRLAGGVGVETIEWLASSHDLFHRKALLKSFSAPKPSLGDAARAQIIGLSSTLSGNTDLDGHEFASRMEKVCVDQGAWIARKSLVFEEILRFLGPPMVFVACWYCPHGMALALACARLGIRCADIQHGVIYRDHIAYASWRTKTAGNFDLIPNYFWVWDEKAKSVVCDRETKDGKVVVSGRIWSHSFLSGEDKADSLRELQTRSSSFRRAILYSAQFLETAGKTPPAAGWQNIPPWLLKRIEEDPSTLWLFRAHPRVENGVEELCAILKESCSTDNWEVETSSREPCDAILSLADLHVTHSSSVAIEASEYGIPSILLGGDFARLLQESLPAGCFEFASDAIQFEKASDRLLTRENESPDVSPVELRSLVESHLNEMPNRSLATRILNRVRRNFSALRVRRTTRSIQAIDEPFVFRAQKELVARFGLPLKVVVGAGPDIFPGWISTTYPHFDATKAGDWQSHFREAEIEALLSEHVIEHLHRDEFISAMKNASVFMKDGAGWRVAVPDGNFPDADYIENVRPGGSGPGCDDHKLLYTLSLMKEIVEEAGMRCEPIEWWDEAGEFHQKPWDPEDGMIKRSAEYDSRNQHGALKYTSLMVDIYKD